MKPLNPYIGFAKGEQEEAACLIFACTAREAKRVGWSIVRGWLLYADDFIDMRVKRLEKTPYIMSFCKQDLPHATEEMKVVVKVVGVRRNMKCQVYNRITQQFEDFDCIVTQKGRVAFWDDGAGWVEVERSDKYIISWDCEFAGRCWKESLKEALKWKSYGCPGSGM